MKNFTWEVKPYKHFGKCLFVSNGVVVCVAALDFGIRILYFSLQGGKNVFYEQPAEADYLRTEAGWRIYGGHRLAFAPESDKTYWPDNQPVEFRVGEKGVRLDQGEDGYLHIKKSVELRFLENPRELGLRHFIRNLGTGPIEGAPWAISALGPGGILEVPFPSPPGLSPAPSRFISLWNSTSLGDRRLSFKRDGLYLRHRPVDDYFKIGVMCNAGQVYYTAGNQVFCKRFEAHEARTYPDNNVNFEVYAGKYMMELESLAPLGFIEAGEEQEHEEIWSLEGRRFKISG
jgi:hypothetical protein